LFVCFVRRRGLDGIKISLAEDPPQLASLSVIMPFVSLMLLFHFYLLRGSGPSFANPSGLSTNDVSVTENRFF